jgi:hypothetical protein
MEITMLTQVKTVADYQKLPASIRHIIEGGKGKVSKAERLASLQDAVVVAIKEQWISFELAVELLKTNNAYGKRGKELLSRYE